MFPVNRYDEMKRRPRVLYLIPAEGFGGAERQALFHVRNLPEYGFDVVTVTGPGKKVYDGISEYGGDVRYCPYLPKEYGRPFSVGPFAVHAIKSVVVWMRTVLFLAKVVRETETDLFFASRVAGWTLAAPLSRICGIPSIWRFGSCAHGWLRRGLLRLLGFLVPPNAVVANCRAVAGSVTPLINAPLNIIPNGIDERFLLKEMHRCSERKSSLPVVGLAIRPSPDKGMEFLSEVIGIVNGNGMRVHFRIAGEFGWRKKIEDAFVMKGLTDSVIFMGHVDDMPAFYDQCDIVALTSRPRSIEGFPNSLLEAMGLGKPVIATSAGGVPELIENGVDGIVVDVSDTGKFARVLLRLADDPSERLRMGTAAAEKVRECYTSGVVIGQLVHCCASVLNGNDGENADPTLSDMPSIQKTGCSSGKMKAKTADPFFRLFCSLLLIPVFSSYGDDTARSGADPSLAAFRGDCTEYTVKAHDFEVMESVSGKHNYYSIQTDEDGTPVIHADYRPPMKSVKLGYVFPDSFKRVIHIGWEWKVVKAPAGSCENVKGKNDSGASVYLVFRTKIRTFTIKYIISRSLPAGMTFEKKQVNPLHSMYMVVAGSYSDSASGKWEQVTVDVENDCRRLFGADRSVPPIKGIGLMSDGDQTNRHVVAEYRNFTICLTE